MPEPERESEWERRRRLAEIFGDVLPDTTRDERDAGSAGEGRKSRNGPGSGTASDRWLMAQVPPHHGG